MKNEKSKTSPLIPHSSFLLWCLPIDKRFHLLYFWGMQTVVLNIYDEGKTDSLLGLLRDLSYVEVRGAVQGQADDVYAGIPSKLDDDLLQSQLDILEKADW